MNDKDKKELSTLVEKSKNESAYEKFLLSKLKDLSSRVKK